MASSLPSSIDLDNVTPHQMSLHVAPNVQFVEVSSPKRRLAYRQLQGRSPTLLYVPGTWQLNLMLFYPQPRLVRHRACKVGQPMPIRA